MSTPAQDAIGVAKLALFHLDHPQLISERTLRATCEEAIQRFQRPRVPHADDLVELYSRLVAVTPRGLIPYVTLTGQPETPYGCVLANEAGQLVDCQIGKTVDGLVQLIASRHQPVGRGEGRR